MIPFIKVLTITIRKEKFLIPVVKYKNEEKKFDRNNVNLKFDYDIITKNNLGKVSNSGPRVGVGILTGSFYEFANRPASQGGLDIFPAVSMIGYQLEAQYVGTDNFSALAEGFGDFRLQHGFFGKLS